MARRRLLLGLVLVVAVVVVVRVFGPGENLDPRALAGVDDRVRELGVLGPVVFILAYAAGTVAFLPGTPFTLLAGLVFGPVAGTVYALTGASIGATLAFLAGRYFARGAVAGWAERDERLQRLDAGVKKHGWRMLVITRLVPLFPFNAQNYAYGLTRIPLKIYAPLTALLILPGVVVYTFAGGSLGAAGENLGRTFIYLGVAAVFFVMLSLVPVYLRRREQKRGSKA